MSPPKSTGATREKTSEKDTLPVAVTMGEPAGIGPEITLKAWALREESDLPCFFAIGDPELYQRRLKSLEIAGDVIEISKPEDASRQPRNFPVMAVPLAQPESLGAPDPRNATATIAAIERAAQLALNHKVAAIVTSPIHKHTLLEQGFGYPGHTEFLEQLARDFQTGDRESEPIFAVMMLTAGGLRVVPVTVHIPLADVARFLSTQGIMRKAIVTAAALRRFEAIQHPRIAVCGLNPHAGESGDLGTEEERIITPAIEALCAAGIDAKGPFPADTLFHAGARSAYDAVICMYHDQALIPLKTLDFYGGINVTLGLPFIRTSPDHGTAFDIARDGKARADSFIHALRTAAAMADHAF